MKQFEVNYLTGSMGLLNSPFSHRFK